MGRELKRVALDFEHPLHERWPGYLNPHYIHCPECDGSGSPNNEPHQHRLTWTERSGHGAMWADGNHNYAVEEFEIAP